MVTEITRQLRSIADAAEFDREADRLVARWIDDGVGCEAVDDVLAFMEEHPHIDFGSPGSVVHFIERFYGPSYKQSLLASLDRRPTQHTIWLLNRVLNSEREPEARREIVARMDQVADDLSIEAVVRNLARRFADRER